MPSTARDILVAAYATNAANQPDTIAADDTEMLAVVNRIVRALFSRAAEVNPTYFGKRSAQAIASGSWPLPSDAESVVRVELDNGTEVQVVPFDDRAQDTSKPAVYFLGRRFHGCGNVLDPVSGNLVLFYSRTPVDCATLDSELDSDWPESMNGVLIGLVALYLDIKDRRLPDAEAAEGIRQAWMATWEEHLRHVNAAEVRLTGYPRRYPSPGQQASARG
jgi:hypothetical protein